MKVEKILYFVERTMELFLTIIEWILNHPIVSIVIVITLYILRVLIKNWGSISTVVDGEINKLEDKLKDGKPTEQKKDN